MKTHRSNVAVIVGRMLYQARCAAGLSQEAMAELAQIHRTYPSLMELGLRQPTLDVFIRVCRAMDIDPAALMGRVAAALK